VFFDYYSVDDLLNHVLENSEDYPEFDFHSRVNERDSFLEHLIKHNKKDQFLKILNLYNVDLKKKNNNKLLIDTAIESNSGLIIKELIERDSIEKINKIKKVNDNLLVRQGGLTGTIKRLEQDVLKQKYSKYKYQCGLFLSFLIMMLMTYKIVVG
jgi:hypothetical protein